MQDIQIDAAELDQLAERLAQSPELLREAKRQAFEAAAPRLLALVQTQIGGSGRVMSWQEKFVGSMGGYAAVRPRAKTFAASRGFQTWSSQEPETYAVGYITNAINSGHWKRGRSYVQDKRLRGYQAGSSADRVDGKQFYETAQEMAAPVARQAAEEIVATLMEHLEG